MVGRVGLRIMVQLCKFLVALYEMSDQNLCRLCLNYILGKSVTITEVVREVLYVLLPNLNIDKGSVNVMCGICFKKFLAAFQFKVTCLYTEDKIFPYINDSKTSQLDLREIYLKEKGMQQHLVSTSPDHKICRLCMEPVKRNFKTISEMDFYMFRKFLPEINFGVVEYPIVCEACHESFGIHTEFLKKCLQVEEQITKFSNEESSSLKIEEVSIKHEEHFSEEMFIDKRSIEAPEEIEMVGKSYSFVEDGNMCKTLSKSEMSNIMVTNKSEEGTEYKKHLVKHQFLHKDLVGVTMYKCVECKFETKYKKDLKTHLFKHKDPSEVKMYNCGECSYETKYKYVLKRHQLRHKDPSEVQVYRCNDCDYKSITKVHLKRHEMTHKDPSEVQMYKCEECSFETKHKIQLQEHQLRHRDPSEVQMYKCGECKYESKFKGSLRKHQLKHKAPSEVKMYRCSECKYETKYKVNLKRHQLRHKDPSEVRMYKCGDCKFQTMYKGVLPSHQLTHKDPSEVQMYKCGECRYEAKQKRYLINHMFIHKNPSDVQM